MEHNTSSLRSDTYIGKIFSQKSLTNKKYAYFCATKMSHLHEPSPNLLFFYISQPEWHLAAGWDMCVLGG
jgi:hypothetical protein